MLIESHHYGWGPVSCDGGTGVASGFLTSFADESQVVLAAILDQSQDCILLLSAEGDLEYMNKNAREALEVEDFGEVSGRSWAEL